MVNNTFNVVTQQWNICFKRYAQERKDANALGILNPITSCLGPQMRLTTKKPDYAIHHVDFVMAKAWNKKIIISSTYVPCIEYKYYVRKIILKHVCMS